MTGLLENLGLRLAERILPLLVLPGLLYLGALATAIVLGGGNLPVPTGGVLREMISSLAAAGVPQPAITGVLVTAALVALLLASAAAGLAARAAGALAARCWTRAWPAWTGPLTTEPTAWRQRRWRRAAQRYATAAESAPHGGPAAHHLDELAEARNRIGLQLPERATWMADRMLATDRRIWGQYGLDLTFCWPRLWLLITEEVRTEVRTARERLASATVLAGWGALYSLLAVWWPPALLLGVAVGVTGWRRSRTATGVLCELVEAVVDVHGTTLAVALGMRDPEAREPIERSLGLAITERLRKAA